MHDSLHDTQLNAIALALTPGIGNKTIRRLLATFGTLDAILDASLDQLQTVQGIGLKTAAAVRAIRLPELDADLQKWTAQGVRVVTWLDTDYPAPLTTLNDAPLVLFYRGTLTEIPAIAIVGTREPTDDSIRLAESLAAEFAVSGWTVVSGLARGIDSAAHRGALSGGGRTMAVLGCGVNVIYPPENRDLAQQIIRDGTILSECHPHAKPAPTALTIRNRIITGLSRAVIIIEAGATSGALHAARKAQAQGRPVFAIENGSAGNAELLANGAQVVTSVREMMGRLTSPPNLLSVYREGESGKP